MSLFGSLWTSVSGLNAQSQATAVISNNIANVSTTGFKRSEATFASLVTVESASARYSPGSVQVNRFQRVDQQGQIQQTASTTDVSVNGEGFLVVRDANDLDIPGEFQYTRNGQFLEDEEGVLVNTAGKYLYGWPVDPTDADPNSDPTSTVFNADLSALVPVDVSLANGETRITTEANLGINLDADEVDNIALLQDSIAAPPVNLLPYAQDFVPDYSRTVRVYDSLGSGQDVTYQYTKVYGPQATEVSTVTGLEIDDSLTSRGLTIGDAIDLTVGGNPAETFTVTATSTVGNLIDFVNSYNTSNTATGALNAEGQIVITAVGFTDDLTLADGAGTPLATLGLAAGTITPIGTLPPNNLDGTFPELVNDPTSPTSAQYNPGGWWQVNIVGPSPTIPLAQGLINFNSDGTLNAQQDVNGNVDIELENINWGNSSDLQSYKTDIQGLTQFSGLYNVAFASQNGSALGLKTGVEIDSDGYVNARFSNGTLSRLFKLPIATFASSPMLNEVSGTAYTESAESGTVLLNEAGTSVAGSLEGATLEQSNVDLADEFSRLIVTQRAYSANTRVINTVDQMTEDLLRLR